MTEYLIWWSVQFSLSFMDFVMMYFISHAMMKKYIRVEWMHVVLCLIYTIIIAPIFYFFDGFTFRFVSIPFLLALTKFIIQRIKISDLIMIYVMSFLIVGVVQIPIAGAIWLINHFFNIHDSIPFFLGQSISIVVVILLCQKLHWHKWFNAVQSHNILKLIVCLASLVVLIPTAIINFEYSISYFLLLTLAFVLAGAVLVPIFVTLYKDVVDIISIKNFKSSLRGWWLDMEDEKDAEVLKHHFKETVGDYGIDLPEFNRLARQERLEKAQIQTAEIEKFIKQKVETGLILDLDYRCDYNGISFQQVLDWLEVLLNHALVTTDQPIDIYLTVLNDRLRLNVIHEFHKNDKLDNGMLIKEAYPLKDISHELYHLATSVIEKEGYITIKTYEDLMDKIHYLDIKIWFEKEDFF